MEKITEILAKYKIKDAEIRAQELSSMLQEYPDREINDNSRWKITSKLMGFVWESIDNPKQKIPYVICTADLITRELRIKNH